MRTILKAICLITIFIAGKNAAVAQTKAFKGQLKVSTPLKEGSNFIGSKEDRKFYLIVKKGKVQNFEIQTKASGKSINTFTVKKIERTNVSRDDSDTPTTVCICSCTVCIEGWGCVDVVYQVDCRDLPNNPNIN